MKSTLIAAALFVAGVTARGHTWCQCIVNGKFDRNLSLDACAYWSSIWPNSQWDADKVACADYHPHGSIDDDGWLNACQARGAQAPYNLESGRVRESCWS